LERSDEAHFSTEQPQAVEETRLSPSHVDARRPGDPSFPAAKGPSPLVGVAVLTHKAVLTDKAVLIDERSR
jgi:hypothetical protein